MLTLAVCACVTDGVWATWTYATLSSNPLEKLFGTDITEFEYKIEVVAPDEDYPAALEQSHSRMVEIIINEASKGYALNASDKSPLHTFLSSQGVLYCDQKGTAGANFKFAEDGVGEVFYCMRKINATEESGGIITYHYELYTFLEDDLMSASPDRDQTIEVFKTIIKYQYWSETGKTEWDDEKSYKGKAEVISINGYKLSSGKSIDMVNWTAVKPTV